MPKTLINTNISPTELTLKPGTSPAVFEVNAVNYSDRFASFQLELIAAGVDGNSTSNWYVLSPEISTKKPPGDRTQFIVKIIDTPLPGFIGQMNLTVRVFSIELQEETRQLLRLDIQEGTGGVALKLNLPVSEFQAYPQQQIKIPIQIYNPSSYPANTTLKLEGIDPAWLIEEKQALHIGSHLEIDTFFLCQIPHITQAKSQIYPITITALLTNGLSSHIQGSLSVLPKGTVEFRCSPKEHFIPNKKHFFHRSNSATFELELENYSNVPQICQIEFQSEEKIEYSFVPEQVDLDSGETKQISLMTTVKRPWFGRVKKLLIELNTELSDQRLNGTSPRNQTLKLKVSPLIPTGLLIISLLTGGGLILWLLWSHSYLNPDNPNFGHEAAVNSVQLDGLARTVISGSEDQRLGDWEVTGFLNPLVNQLTKWVGDPKKSVRIIRYRPVDNNLIAVGLENGEIQMWELIGDSRNIHTFSYQKDDRVFGLEFTQDARSLFSGHGSGLVLQWDTNFRVGERKTANARLLSQKNFDFAVYALKFVGEGDKNLAVVGRYNQFFIWNPSAESFKVPYPPGSQNDYIFTVDVAAFSPYILATGDNQGNITIWNMETCLLSKSGEDCQVIDRWQANELSKAVRSVSLSENACYLASGGDDGKVTVWALNSEGKRVRDMKNGAVIKKEVNQSYNNQKINSVHLKTFDDHLYVASGSDDTQVRVAKEAKKNFSNSSCDSQNKIAP